MTKAQAAQDDGFPLSTGWVRPKPSRWMVPSRGGTLPGSALETKGHTAASSSLALRASEQTPPSHLQSSLFPPVLPTANSSPSHWVPGYQQGSPRPALCPVMQESECSALLGEIQKDVMFRDGVLTWQDTKSADLSSAGNLLWAAGPAPYLS